MLAYDFEVFRYNWLVVAIDPNKRKSYVIWDDPKALENLHEEYKSDIWVGFNSRHYDQYILKAILCGFDAWEINDHIINKEQPGWSFSSLLRKIFLINYDVAPLGNSLKQLEGFQGHNIHESSVDFRLDRPLTDEEKAETVKYCTNDVEETLNVLAANIDDFKALLWLVKEFKFPLSYMSKTKAQISTEILECEKVERSDEWDLFTLDCIKLKPEGRWLNVKKKKKKGVLETKNDKVVGKVFLSPKEWFLNTKYQDYKYYFETIVAGVKHVLAWGGIHGAKEKYHYKCDEDHLMLHVDVESYYPRLMIFHNLLTRNAKKPERFKAIFNQRMKLKHEGKKKEQAPLKIVINGTYGIMKDATNKAYDPRNANLVCINGQLLLLDLIEKLEAAVPSFELIQSNTDGLIIKIAKKDFELVDDVCYEWESRTNMILGFDYIKEIWQGDVNNYVFVDYDGNVERKGAYVKELSSMDNDLPIINKAINDYLLKGIKPEETINACDDLIMYQKICKLSKKFNHVTHNEKTYYNKCYRVFASRSSSDGSVKKIKLDGRADKFANTSINSFIENGNIEGVKVPMRLDKQWYIDLANDRIEKKFGIAV